MPLRLAWWAAALGLGAFCLWATPLAAQQTRNQRLQAAFSAYDNFQPDQALDLLQRALNPSEGPQDSVWFPGVQLLAQILIEKDRAAEAATWLRWALRLAPRATVDSINFVPEVVAAAREAQAAVQGGSPGDSVTHTTWEWAAPGAGANRGLLRVQSPGMAQPVRALVQGQLIESGQSLALVPGTYQIQAAAEGYLTALVRREVLPGITTVLSFDLAPVGPVAQPLPPLPPLPPPVQPQPVPMPPAITPSAAQPAALSEAARSAVERQLVPVTASRFGTSPGCGVAAFVARSGLVLTSYRAIRGADRVELELTGGRRLADEVRVAAYDLSTDLAVLQLPTIRSDSLPLAAAATAGQPVWALSFTDCRTPRAQRAVLEAARATGLELGDSIPWEAGPLVNAAGQLVGWATGARTGAPGSAIQALLDRARRAVAQGEVLTPGQVALRENHAFGSVAVSADLPGVEARVTPLETWQWAGSGTTAELPFTFAGPMGRYHLELRVGGQLRRELDFTIRPAVADRLTVTLAPVAQQPQPVPVAPAPQVEKRGGGGGGVVLAVLGLGGAGAAVYFLAAKKGGQSGGTQPPPTSTGTITISVPNPSVIGTILGILVGR